ncbi:MAG: exopolyphosphatase [Synergistaceae bacterium]|nr:exopolyphosphatase [Synergistaceae bacterium]
MRLVTRSDFDGLMGAVLLKELGLISSKKFVHPKDIQDGITEINENDILVNVPYDPRCGLWFDHHISEEERGIAVKFNGASWPAPSAARVIYEYYGGDHGELAKFSEMIVQTDKCDSANFTREEVLNPSGMVLLSFIMDPRTGFGNYHHFHVSNYQLMEELIECLRTMTIDEIMALEDIQERVQLYEEHREPFIRMMRDFSHTEGSIIITDLRGVEDVYVGNRHIIYALYQDQNISLRLFEGKPGITVISVGYSILNRTATVNVGSLLLKFGGGGHKSVGTCQVPADEADGVLAKIIEEINASNWLNFDINALPNETV